MRITLYKFALKNLQRKYFRSVAVAISVAVVAATLFSVSTVMLSVDSSLKRGAARLGADLVVVPAVHEKKARAVLTTGEAATFYMEQKLLDPVRDIKIRGPEGADVKGVEAVSPQLFLEAPEHQWPDDSRLRIVAFEPETDFTVTPWLEEHLKRRLETHEVFVGHEVRFGQEGKIKLLGQDFVIVGALEATGMAFIDKSVFMTIPAARQLVRSIWQKSKRSAAAGVEGVISAIMVRTEATADPNQVGRYIKLGIKGLAGIATEEVIVSVQRQLLVLLRSIFLISIVLWVIAILMIGVIFSMIVNERQREVGLLRAMGATRLAVFRLVMLESSTLSGIGGGAGIIVGGVFLVSFKGVIKASLNMPYLWPGSVQFVIIIGACLILAFMTGVGASLFPALRVSLMEPYRAISIGE